MSIFKKEMKQGGLPLAIWTAATAFMIMICVLIFPQMKDQMSAVTDMFANMGGFTAAFGMDQVSFGEIMGFYAIECGNILGIGAGFYAAYIGISILAKEEKDRTAEFLLTHPVSRMRVLIEKLLAVFVQLVIFNLAVVICAVLSFGIIGEDIAWKEFLLLHLAFFVLQIEIACICFGVSAFLHRSGIGIGLGLAALFYFINIVHNISGSAEFLKYCTPFAYADASNIVANARIDGGLFLLGLVLSLVGIAAGFIKYIKKDISA